MVDYRPGLRRDIVNYLSRSSLSVAAPAMMKELHFDEQQYSWVVSAFQLCYTIAQPITGYLMDVIGLKIGFFIFALLWSLINMAHALAGGWISLAFLRGLMGLTEASAIPAGIKASAEWFPTKERGIAGACLISVLRLVRCWRAAGGLGDADLC